MSARVINISLPEELLKDIEKVAKRERRTRSEFFREAARRYMQGIGSARATVVDASWKLSDRQAFSAASADSLNRIWDNPIDAEIWDNWEERHAARRKASTR